MKIIDTHTHLYGKDFAADLPDVVRRAKEAGVVAALLPNLNAASLPDLHAAEALAPDFFYPMIGMHPTEMGEEWQQDLELLHRELLAHPTRYIAIGEIGLDYYWSTDEKEAMNSAFRTQLTWARDSRLPVSIHSRSATMDAVAAVKEVGADAIRGVFHSFTDSPEELMAILRLPHFMVGVNGVLTFKNSTLRDFLPDLLPLDRLVVETDAPYLSPVPNRGKRNEPANLLYVIDELAKCYRLPREKVAQQVFANSVEMFALA